jgi:hypothetical protein
MLHLITPIAVPFSDRSYPQIFIIPFVQGKKSGDKCERFASSNWFCTLRLGVTLSFNLYRRLLGYLL